MSDHPWNDWRVTAYALGELDEPQRSAFERELADDPRLHEAVAEATRITRAVSVSLGREPAPILSDARRAELFSHFSGEDPMSVPAPTKRAGRRGRSYARLAIAASLCLVIGGAVALAIRVNTANQLAERDAPDMQLAADAAVSRGRTQSSDSMKRQFQSSADEASEASETSVSGPASPQDFAGDGAAPASGLDLAATPPPATEALAQQVGQRGYRASASGARSPHSYGGAKLYSDSLRGVDGETENASTEDVSGGYGELAAGSGYGGASPYEYNSRSEVADGLRFRHSEVRVVPRIQSLIPGERQPPDEGRGPGRAGDQFEPITDNPFLRVVDNPLSTFSIDVDTASYSKVRQYLIDYNQLPRPDAVRIEEMINYFDYRYDPPAEDAEHPFAASIAIASCPWNPEHRLARIGIKGRTMENEERPSSNLVFLLDVSGSMDQPNKLPLVKRGMQMLLEQLGENDRVAIVVYAGAAGMVLDSTTADRQQEIYDALERLHGGGSTNGGEGIRLAYATARDHFVTGGTNRVILCTDGDFNVGTTGTDQLVRMVEKEAQGGIFLTVLGFGMGNHNDAMLEQISGRGNGNYAFIDTENEARKVLVQQTASTLVTIAKDVKIQVEFNPNQVAGYRLIGYETRLLAKEDFNDDTKDAGEIGAGHTVTALYELVPAGEPVEPAAPEVDSLKYQTPATTTEAADNDEMLTLKLRYKQPDGDKSTLVEFPAKDSGQSLDAADRDFRFAAAVAGFGMLLRNSPYKGNWTYSAVEEVARDAQSEDPHGLRSEFVRMVRKAAEIAGE